MKISTKFIFTLGNLLEPYFNKHPGLVETLRSVNFRGKTSLIRSINWGQNGNEVTAECNHIFYELNLDDVLQKDIYFNLYSRAEIRSLLKDLPDDGVCLDVGANVGFFTLNFAKAIGRGGKVYSFEPDPNNYDRLIKNINMNDFNNVKAYPFAVTNKESEAAFYVSDENNSGWGSLIEFKDIALKTINVKTVTLDSFLEKEAVNYIDLIKIDIEANELELLEGASDSLNRKVFKQIFIEFNGPRLTERQISLEDFLEPLEKNNYLPDKKSSYLIEKLKNNPKLTSEIITDFLFLSS